METATHFHRAQHSPSTSTHLSDATGPRFGNHRRFALGILLVLASGSAGNTLPAQSTIRVSVSTSGIEGNQPSEGFTISEDGRFVAFSSKASNLVPGDLNRTWDAFVHDSWTGVTELLSAAPSGGSGNEWSKRPAISADGRYVAFESFASDLVPNDINGAADVFLLDRSTGQIERISLDSAGGEGNGDSVYAAISATGQHVAFKSVADNLVAGDSNGQEDIFVRDRSTSATTRVSVSSLGVEGNGLCREPDISADGRLVVFLSGSDNIVPGDTNGAGDIFLHDRLTGQTTRVSVDSNGVQGNNNSIYACLSANGRYVAIKSEASNLVPNDFNGHIDVFLRDLQAGTTELISVSSNGTQGNLGSKRPSISAGGRFVAFKSQATNLVPGDTNGESDVFVRDRLLGTTERLSVSTTGAQGDSWSLRPSVSADGRWVAFWSNASNLVPGDSNGVDDVFLRDLGPRTGENPDALVLAGPYDAPIGAPLELVWFAATAGADYWLAWSRASSGSLVGGHTIDLGAPVKVLSRGVVGGSGAGSYLSPPAPAAAAGLTLFFEMLTRDPSGSLLDSNALATLFQ